LEEADMARSGSQERSKGASQRLAAADLTFPLIYTAHEVPKEKTKDLVVLDGGGPVAVGREVGIELVGPIPEPHTAVALGETLGQRSQQVLQAAARGARIAGLAAVAVAAAPVVLVGGAIAGMATLTDPIVIGAIPAGLSTVGTPAAWYCLQRWDW
jgi:hypothetical protein